MVRFNPSQVRTQAHTACMWLLHTSVYCGDDDYDDDADDTMMLIQFGSLFFEILPVVITKKRGNHVVIKVSAGRKTCK